MATDRRGHALPYDKWMKTKPYDKWMKTKHRCVRGHGTQLPVRGCRIGQKGSVDNVHTLRPGLACTTIGLLRIPHVSATSQ